MNKKGIALILIFSTIAVLTAIGAAIVLRSVAERTYVQQYTESTQAFWLAEAGIHRAKNELRSNYNATGTNIWQGNLISVPGGYNVSVANVYIDAKLCKNVTAYGYVPAAAPYRAQRSVRVIIKKQIPANFYDNAIYTSGDLDINGDSYSVTGNILYAGDYDVEHDNISGTATQDSSISPLARFDFAQLKILSQAQGNFYDITRITRVEHKQESFPSTFWYTRADDGVDNDGDGTIDEADEWVPNILYLEGDLTLNGDIGTVGGFFVVVGDVITDPDDTEDMTINGNGTIDGVIYTRGEFRINGGGGNLNINGGVWSGIEARLNGNAHIAYNQAYMDSIQGLNIEPDIQITSWKESINPYKIYP
ncbi:MAG: hypothetical protein PHG31_04625 [Candidatus Omnitrophica bacterium]|nr:hypothetical protein [Candidatus Omnitrophota bacterium]